jgi:protease-4
MNEQVVQKNRARGRNWIWVALAVLAVFVVPAMLCGICSLSAGLMGAQSSGPAFGPAVAIIPIEGVIFSGEGSGGVTGGAGSETIIDLIARADDDPSVRAIVLRIDSPGGDVVASDEIYHALTQVNKPIVVSMGSMAASGGYYVAMSADRIYATPHTLTGSIGVISQFITADDLLDEIGVEMVVITSGTMKDFGSPYRDMTEEERAYWQVLSDEAHDSFIQLVADSRGMDVEEVRSLADGRVFSGLQAVELGLIDNIGYLDDAIAAAAELGGIVGEPRVITLEPEPSLLSALYGAQAQRGLLPSVVEILEMTSTPSFEFRYTGP